MRPVLQEVWWVAFSQWHEAHVLLDRPSQRNSSLRPLLVSPRRRKSRGRNRFRLPAAAQRRRCARLLSTEAVAQRGLSGGGTGMLVCPRTSWIVIVSRRF